MSARYSAKTAAATTRLVGQSDRFADWQMHKRDLYGALLSSIREATDTKHRLIMGERFDAAFLVANEPLRNELRKYFNGIVGNPEPGDAILGATEYQQLVDKMLIDVDTTPRQEAKRKEEALGLYEQG